MYFYGTEEACAQVGDVLLYFHSYIIVCLMILLPKEYYRYTLYVIGMSRGRYGTFLETAVGSSAPSTGNYSLQNTMQYLVKK